MRPLPSSAKIIPAIYNDLSQHDALSPPKHKYPEKLVATLFNKNDT